MCFLRVNVRACANVVELLLMAGDTTEAAHLPPSGHEQKACLAISCDSNHRSTEAAILLADTYDPRNAAAVEPNGFEKNYGKLYATEEECMTGTRKDAEAVCEKTAVAAEEGVYEQTPVPAQENDYKGMNREYPRFTIHLLFLSVPFGPHSDTSDLGAHIQWDNDYQKDLKVQCSDRQALYQVKSEFSKDKNDRRWQWNCRATTDVSHKDCKWSSYINDWDGPMMQQCGANRFLAGMESYFSGSKRDRRWKMRCCEADNHYTQDCYLTGWENSMQGDMDYSNGSPRVLVGVFSYHDNGKE